MSPMGDKEEFSIEGWMSDRMQKKTASSKKPVTSKKGPRSSAVNRRERDRSIKSKYGVSLAWYEEQVLKQGGVCYICKSPPSKRTLSIDHCHKTGAVRKLLCSNCNVTLGLTKEDTSVLNAMIGYIEEHVNS